MAAYLSIPWTQRWTDGGFSSSALMNFILSKRWMDGRMDGGMDGRMDEGGGHGWHV